jgi:cytochrome P450
MATITETTTTTAPIAPLQQSDKRIPRIEELPLLGRMQTYNHDRLGFVLALSRSCGDAARFHFGPFPVVFFNSAELMHGVLVEHANEFDTGVVRRNAFGPVIGNGLFVSEGELHRRQRKTLAPAFQPRHIKSYANTMVTYGERAQVEWTDGEVVGINHEMIQITMSIIGKVLFDADVFTEADELGAAITVALEHVNYMFSHLLPIPLSWPLPRHARTRRSLAFLRAHIQEMIAERRASNIEGQVERDDFLSILLRARDEDGNPMSDQQVSDEAITFFGAGHETTATGLTWAWYLLAGHPEAYARLRAEVDAVLGGRAPTYDDLARLPYTLQVFKEALRLYPPAYALSRVALRDVTVGGYRVKRGTTVFMSPYALHRRADYFPSPACFDPERFTPKNEARLPRYTYMPFGAGPRICIGNHFALMEGQLLLATLAQRVTFALVTGQEIVPDPKVTTRPKGDIQMVVHRRGKA